MLSQMLEAGGELDAVTRPRPPKGYGSNGHRPNAPVSRRIRQVGGGLFPRKTGLFPLMHAIGIRRSLVERHPGFPSMCTRRYQFQGRRVR